MPAARSETGAVAAIGFGMTVAMWGAGYLSRMPGLTLPSPLVLALMLAAMAAGGLAAGRYSARPLRTGALAGLLAAALNLLILGGLLSGSGAATPRRLALAALLALGFGAGWGAAFARLGARRPAPPERRPDWIHALAAVASAAAFLLLFAGGLVTSHDAGLAVPDWPNSYGYNMFLYPLSRMTGGIYYEHAHRLLGSLVGLTTIGLALVAGRADRRPAVRVALGGTVLFVIVQGLLGGLRVTGRLTLSQDASVLRPSLALAVVHGVTGQLFFASVVVLAIVLAPRWKALPQRAHPTAPADRALTAVLVALLAVQLVLGALVRHAHREVLAHVAMGVLVAAVALAAGLRAWGLHPGVRPLARLGLGVTFLAGAQLLLGFGAFSVTQTAREGAAPWYEVLLATAHQATGALLLAASCGLCAWSWRLARPRAD